MVGFNRKGFWRDKRGIIYMGPIESNSEYFYGYFNEEGCLVLDRESPYFPLTDMLNAIPFDQGVKHLAKQANARFTSMAKRLEEAEKQIAYLELREAPVIIQEELEKCRSGGS